MAFPLQQVLVVDDDPDIRASLDVLLQDEGYVVHEAPDGNVALKQLRRSSVRLVVLLDILMPGVDGIAVLEAVAAQQELSTRHAYIVMTAHAGRTVPLKMAHLLLELHIPILTKPFDIDTVLAAVHTAAQRLKTSS